MGPDLAALACPASEVPAMMPEPSAAKMAGAKMAPWSMSCPPSETGDGLGKSWGNAVRARMRYAIEGSGANPAHSPRLRFFRGAHKTARMTDDDVLKEFRGARALLTGHFVLTSGLHSNTYLQCARVMMDAGRGGRLCAALAEKLKAAGAGPFDLVTSPAMGGVVVGYEMGRQLGVPALFFERVDGEFQLRRGFTIEPGARVLMVEDVVTTGLSSRECIKAIAEEGGVPVAAACLVDRSGGKADLGVPLTALVTLDIRNYPADALPPELAAIPAVKPGSRGLR